MSKTEYSHDEIMRLKPWEIDQIMTKNLELGMKLLEIQSEERWRKNAAKLVLKLDRPIMKCREFINKDGKEDICFFPLKDQVEMRNTRLMNALDEIIYHDEI